MSVCGAQKRRWTCARPIGHDGPHSTENAFDLDFGSAVEWDNECEPHWTERPGFRTFEEFAATPRLFDLPRWRAILLRLPPRTIGLDVGTPRTTWTVDWWGLAFELRIRVPDAAGWFARTKADGSRVTGASWCLPWNWKRRYYEHRVLSQRPKRDARMVTATR